ncbi:MAG TPA: formylglycine-generating enzyme family protein [Candidatus Nitrosotalea sp.]|nr:formylglycine-generating enzyme family protein [Candidatus Nitrosotalea sp.]
MAALLTAQTPEPSASPERAPGVVFEDCEGCPELVVIPAGSFTMGSTAAQKTWAVAHGATAASVADEAPQHRVTIHAFAMGEYDVTRAQYAQFVQASGYATAGGCALDSIKTNLQPDLNWGNPRFPQDDLDPVVCVSWRDAQAYIAWLNGKLPAGAHPFRLPSEAEWEYAARAGTSSLFFWGDDPKLAAERAWYDENSNGRTQPVGGKPANDFGLFDIVGNVWQWTQDCYTESYDRAPADGRAVEGGDSCLRVDRGGSWLYALWFLRSTTRERNPADFRDRIMGFRVARDL